MAGETINVFVSYSHDDASLVAPVVRLLRVNKSLVFQDTDSITPGTKWREEIGRALSEANLVVVFWCRHAHQSMEVASEWAAAIEQGKDLLPLLLDATPLPPALAEYQWIDFRGTVGPAHRINDSLDGDDDRVRQPPVVEAPRKSSRWQALSGLVVAGVAAVVATLILLRGYYTEPFANADPDGGPLPTPPPPAADATASLLGIASWLLLAMLMAIGFAAVLWFRRHRDRVRLKKPTLKRTIQEARVGPGDIERRLASRIEAEILRRSADA